MSKRISPIGPNAPTGILFNGELFAVARKAGSRTGPVRRSRQWRPATDRGHPRSGHGRATCICGPSPGMKLLPRTDAFGSLERPPFGNGFAKGPGQRFDRIRLLDQFEAAMGIVSQN